MIKNGYRSRNRLAGCAAGLLCLLLALPACDSTSSVVSGELGKPSSISIGQTLSFAGEDLSIRFAEVISDSRCPTGVECVWAGEVSVAVQITYFKSLHHKTLVQSGAAPGLTTAFFNEYKIAFKVTPYPSAGSPIKQGNYRLELTVTREAALSGGVLVTFDVVGEKYSVFFRQPDAIRDVLAVYNGTSQAGIPSGRVIRGGAFYNQPWSWHIDPDDIQMVEVTIELCDGRPSDLEADVDYWVNTVGRYCPWGATIVAVEDFR